MRLLAGIGTVLLAIVFVVFVTPVYIAASILKRIWK